MQAVLEIHRLRVLPVRLAHIAVHCLWRSTVPTVRFLPALTTCFRPRAQVKVWDLETRKITRRLRGQDGWIWCLEQFGDSGDLLATGATDGAVRLWDQRTGEQARAAVRCEPNSIT